jgi:hypothetical protein
MMGLRRSTRASGCLKWMSEIAGTSEQRGARDVASAQEEHPVEIYSGKCWYVWSVRKCRC